LEGETERFECVRVCVCVGCLVADIVFVAYNSLNLIYILSKLYLFTKHTKF